MELREKGKSYREIVTCELCELLEGITLQLKKIVDKYKNFNRTDRLKMFKRTFTKF